MKNRSGCGYFAERLKARRKKQKKRILKEKKERKRQKGEGDSFSTM